MKRILLALSAMLFCSVALAQAPALFNYQGVARDAAGAPIAGHAIGLQLSIHDGGTTGEVVYQEQQTATTNAFGLYNVQVGNGTAIIGTLGAVNWAAGTKFMQVEIDPSGGTSYVDAGNTQLVSVPYAVYADVAAIASTAYSLSGTLGMGGDVAGTTGSSTVIKLQGVPVAAATPATGQVLEYTGSQWTPTTPTSGGSGTVTSVTAGTGLSGGTITTSGTISMPSIGTAGTYGSATQVPVITTDAQGRVSGITTASITGGSGTVTSVTAGTGLSGGTITTAGTISMPGVGTAGTYGSATQIPVFTTDAQGRVSSVTNTAISAGTVTSVTAGTGLSGGTITSSGTISLPGVGTAGTYGSATQIPVITTDAQGRVSSVSTAGISVPTISGTANYITKYTSSTSIGNSILYDNGTSVGLGTTAPSGATLLHVSGVGTYSSGVSYGQAGIVVNGGTSSTGTGVFAESGGIGVYGHNNGSSGATTAMGVYGVVDSGSSYTKAYGVYGNATGGGATNIGLYGNASGGTTTNIGCYASGTLGIYGYGSGTGVYGRAYGSGSYYTDVFTDRQTAGVVGEVASVTSGDPVGVFGHAKGTVSQTGMLALSENGSSNYGLETYAYYCSGSINRALYAYSDGSGSSSDFAGYFDGKIYATDASSGIKAFKIDDPLDPENKYLYHSSVESNDMMDLYNGNVTTDEHGDATITLPRYFTTLNKEYKYQLTCIGQFAQAIVAEEISDNHFKIKTDKPNVKVSWQVAGVRQDPLANAHRVQEEVEKPASEKGLYLVPEVYGYGRNRSIGFAQSSVGRGIRTSGNK